MDQVDPAPPVQHVQALHHIVGLARPWKLALVGNEPRSFTARHQGGHGPEPGLLGAGESTNPSLYLRLQDGTKRVGKTGGRTWHSRRSPGIRFGNVM